MGSWRSRVAGLIALAASLAISLPATAAVLSAFRPPQQLGFPPGDDWEPAVAVDGSWVYAFWMHFGANPPDCPLPAISHMVFQESADGGKTWFPPKSIACQAEFQADAQLAVTQLRDGTHRVYASWMDSNQIDSPIWVAFSDDFGSSWKGPVLVTRVDHGGSGGDKDILVADGRRVWVTYEHLVNSFVAFTPDIETQPFAAVTVPTPSGTVCLASGGALDSHTANLFFTWDCIANQGIAKGPTTLLLGRSADSGSTWQTSVIDVSQVEPMIPGASYDFFGASVAFAIIPAHKGQPADRLVAVYQKGLAPGATEQTFTKYSDDQGQTWLSAIPGGTPLSGAPAAAMQGFPAAVADLDGVQVSWMDNRVKPVCTSATVPGACGTWHVWTRASADGISGWTAETRIDQPAGFGFPYGDYQSRALQTGVTYAAWGEAADENGPGNIWFTRN